MTKFCQLKCFVLLIVCGGSSLIAIARLYILESNIIWQILSTKRADETNVYLDWKPPAFNLTKQDKTDRDRIYYVSYETKGGRLGNRIFQVAALFGFAETFNYIPADYMKLDEMRQWFRIPKLAKIKIIDSFFFHMNNHKAQCSFHPSPFPINRNITLPGCINDYKSFGEHEAYIRKVLRFTEKVSTECKRKFMELKGSDEKTRNSNKHSRTKPDAGRLIIGIHTRRGDIVNFTIGKIPSEEAFVHRAIDFVIQESDILKNLHFRDYKFVIYGDDRPWNLQVAESYVRSRYPFSRSNERPSIVVPESSSPVLDLCVLTLCDHMIMTTGSTFAWWAAFLGRPNRTIYYPEFYYSKGSLKFESNRHHMMPYWVKLT